MKVKNYTNAAVLLLQVGCSCRKVLTCILASPWQVSKNFPSIQNLSTSLWDCCLTA